jgi:hypothetical protein
MRLAVRLPVFALAVFLVSACSGGTEAPVATSIAVSPTTTLNFTSINQTTQLTGAVISQHGDTIQNQGITWSSNNTAVATVSNTGLVTAKGSGSTTVTATNGSIHADIAVNVAQAPAGISKTAGDGQSGTVGQTLATSLTVTVLDGLGSPVVGAPVTFAVTGGGGSVGTPSTSTSGAGTATTTWTLGTNSSQAQSVLVTAGAATVTFTATATAAAAAAVVVNAGNNQTAATGTAVATKPSVKVTDSFGNAKAGVGVTFAVASGGGSVTGANATTNAAGIATVGNWTLGSAGANTLSATATGVATAFTFTATAVTPGAPTTMATLVGDGQTALVGYATNIRPAVKVTDANNLGVSGVSVTFAVGSGGGSATGTTVLTNSQGIAQVGKWTVGAAAASNTMTATSGSLTGSPVTFTVTGAAPTFAITLQNVGPAFSPNVQLSFDSALARWQRTIYVDVPDVSVNLPANGCGTAHPAVNQLVDDILIMAKIDSIDGPGNIIGSAGFCVYRTGSLLPLVAIMRFDSADLGSFSVARLRDVILHEMGHALGYGTLWPNPIAVGFPGVGCLNNPSSNGNPADTYYGPGANVNAGFTCTQAVAMFDSVGGLNYALGNKVPLENLLGPGSSNSHWRESTLKTELMTPVISQAGTNNEFSALSIASMADLGYTVNLAAADAYTVPQPFGSAALRAGASGGISLAGDGWIGPLYEATPSGGIRRVR